MVLKNYLVTSFKSATYFSKTTQNNLTKACGSVICKVIMLKGKKAKYFTIIANDCSNYSNTQPLSLCLRL